MHRLDEGIYIWGYFNPEKKYNFNGFLLRTGEGTVVVDPPPLSEDDQAYLNGLGAWPELIVVTNRNHVRDRDFFLSRGPVPTAMHEAEVGQAGIEVQERLKDGDSLPGGLKVVHLPGKSPGEIALHWEARGVLIVGDALIAPNGVLKLIPEAKLDDPRKLRKSLQKLGGMDYQTLLLADGDPILRGAKAQVDGFLATLA